MKALLDYWDRVRKDETTGLYVWYDQLESGADNLPISVCPSNLSADCWVTGISGLSVSASDVMTLLYREVISYSKFLESWATSSRDSNQKAELISSALHYKIVAGDIVVSMIKYLWNDQNGLFDAYNVTSQEPVTNRVYLMCFPIFGSDIMTPSQSDRCLEQLMKDDMFTKFGVRSTSSEDLRYNNDNIIVPYSNWRGPVWVVANAILAYGYNHVGRKDAATQIASNMVATLAFDIATTNTWHESYNSVTGAGLAAPGFLSWNTLGATLVQNVKNNVNPFLL